MAHTLRCASGWHLLFEAGTVCMETGTGVVATGQPVTVERWYGNGKTSRHAAVYGEVDAVGDAIVGHQLLRVDGAEVRVVDRWSVDGDAFILHREVRVEGGADGGFLTEIGFTIPAASRWEDLEVFAPGLLYGDPDLVNKEAIGGRRWLDDGGTVARARVDRLPAPLVAVRLNDGVGVAVLDIEPDGSTTPADARNVAAEPLVESCLRFGAVGLDMTAQGARLAYAFPGTEGEVTYRGDTFPNGQVRGWRRSYHPLDHGCTQQYAVAFWMGQPGSFPNLVRQSWRWAWGRLQPEPVYHDIEQVRTTLVEQLASTVVEEEGGTGVPTRRDLPSGKIRTDLDGAYRTVLGFTGRGTECGWYLLHEAHRVGGDAGYSYRRLGTGILDTLTTLPVSPPVGTGIDLRTGEPVAATPRSAVAGQVRLRMLAEGGKAMARAWRFEQNRGRAHPAWIRWCRDLTRWLLLSQHPDGGFPRSWLAGTDTVGDPSTRSSYNAVPLLAEMYRATGERRYLDAALRTGEFCWSSGHADGVFVGGTLDNPDVVDKEGATVALECYLALYEETQDGRWLDRARVAGDLAETWIYLWNVPMPDGDDTARGWKNGVPTVGVQLIATGHSLVDQYMAWDAPSYAKLARYAEDEHYLHVARLLLHNTKTMLAVPGRCYDLPGPGWQQEHWSLAPPRGEGIHRAWLPWVTCSHIESIVGLEDHGPDLLRHLAAPSDPSEMITVCK